MHELRLQFFESFLGLLTKPMRTKRFHLHLEEDVGKEETEKEKEDNVVVKRMERRSPLINPRYSATIVKSLDILQMAANSQ